MSQLTHGTYRLATALAAACLALAPAFGATVTFRQGENGYTGTQDTFLQQNPPNAGTNNGSAVTIGWDGDDPAGTGFDQYALIRFDSIIGGGAGQIPAGATITSATLRYVVTDVGDVGELHEALTGWTEASTFTSFCGGASCSGSQWGAASVASVPAAATGAQTINVTASVQAWADGAANNGWIVLPTGGGGVDAESSEGTTIANRPLLTVVYNEGPPQASLVRQPYLQLVTPTSATIVWRTDTAGDSRVRYGTTQGILDQTASVATVTTNHIVPITGLSPSTRYYYDVGTTSAVHAGGTANHYFETSPPSGANGAFRVWALGDSGDGSSSQAAVRNAMLTYTASTPPDLFIHVGDIAYSTGTEDEFTNNHFAVYQDILRHTPFWPTLGNHEGSSTTSGQPGASNGPYYDAFVLPTNAEAGGTASGTEAYYSFDYGNTHFIVLNSYQVSRAAGGPMAQWLTADLAATDKQWIIAYWHHPPYTKGTHNSDVEIEHVEMRQNIVPILEAGGVDLVMGGHSHTYERSYLIDGTYTTPTPNFANLESTGHIVDDGDGRPSGDGAYLKNAGSNPHEGAVYVVAGHGGAGTGGSLNHPVMYYSETNHGSCIIDIDANALTLTNLRSTGVVSDTFTIQKGDLPPRVAATVPPKSAVLSALASVQVTFSEAVNGVDAGDLTVNGSVATGMTGSAGTAGPYVFTGFTPPGSGGVSVAMAAGGIVSVANPGLSFVGDSWLYTIDTTPPHVASEIPARGQEVSFLGSVTVEFSKPVTGVAAGDLSVNGSPATSLSGVPGSSGPYTFSGYAAPATGLVSVALASGATQDDQSQPFAGDAWSYSLRPGLVINEFLASNNTTATDENGEFDDYLEIYNPANTAVDMSGMYLTDNLGFAVQYEIPDGVVIPAHGHLIFWCDSQPAQGPMHTNFNLARTGEQIGLFSSEADGFLPIDQLTYTTQTTDVPVGRFPDGQTGFVPMPSTPGSRNTITCSIDAECAALGDQCNAGACSGGTCAPAPINEGLPCDDGIACRGPDTCTAGVCDNGPDTCTGGLTCNLNTGLCEAESVDPLPIPIGATWRYFKGTAAPDPAWATIAYDDTAWLSGASGFGYGPDCTSGRGTTLSDMQNPPSTPGYVSLFLRREFSVANPALVTSVTLTIDYDDAFVAYVNGQEVGRNNVAGSPPLNTALATADRECSTGSPANPAQTVTINPSILVAGTNVIAIQGHNLTVGSSDFTLAPSISSTQVSGCSSPAECNDGNPCTDDTCSAGICSNTIDDTNLCSDGVACTTDTCSAGSCVNVSNCPGGTTCNTGTGLCQGAPLTVTFQQGVSGYAGAVDTYLHAGAPDANNGAVATLIVDGPPPVADERQTLLRFDALFVSQGGPIPDGATITSATLRLNITNPSASGADLHRMLVPWTAASTWNTLTGGVQKDGVEAVAAADVTSLYNGTVPALHTIDVTSSVAAWSTGAVRQGWLMSTPTGGSDSWQFDSAEGATPANRPVLTVTYTTGGGGGCTIDADCDDANVCNGLETCVAGTCQAGSALSCDDSNVCTTDTCHTVTGCQHADNTASCNDANACTSGDVCAGGACAGTPVSCDDGVACTADSCDTGTGCQNVSTCPGGQTCNTTSGLCESAPQTVSFRDGVAGYTGTQDTYLAQAAPTTVEGALDNWRWDTENPAPNAEFGLVRFDGIVGAGPGQVPPGATVLSAALELTIFNASVAPAGEVRNVLVAWDEATTTWSNFGGDAGAQPDEYGATVVAAAPIATGAASIDVTASVQAWVSGSSTNLGWIFVPFSNDGVQVRSAEYATAVAERPRLTVQYATTVSCTVNADCDDGNVCTGTETCVAGSCQAGTPLICNDANVCTDDSCSPTLGCQNVANTLTCDDASACTTGDVCTGGACVGTAISCDDGVACTADSCIPASGCQNVSTCGAGQTCNLISGLCEGTAATVTFQQGVSGYAGAVDTYLHAGAPDANNGAVATLIVDGPPPVADERQTLLRFDALFVSQGGPIPDGATITSATLRLNITNPSASGADLHRMLVPWTAASTWNTLTGGVQKDGVEAVAAADVTSLYNGTVPALHTIDVTSSVAAWSTGAVRQGWLMSTPTGGSDSWQFDSAEGATPANRPLLTVTYSALSGPRGRLRCDPATATVAPGGSVVVDALLDNLTGLAGIRGYQTQLGVVRTSGTGTASIACPGGVQVDELRSDYLFAGVSPTFPAVNCGLKRATSSIATGSVTAGPAAEYLSHATVGISLDAAPGSTFEVSILPAPDSALADAAGDPVAFLVGSTCSLTVAGCGSPADCDDGNPCTDDVCTAGVCSNAVDDTNACSDGNACTVGDACVAGSCVGTPLDCNDGNVCTTDVCTAGVCNHAASGACGITGTVAYYRDSGLASEPSLKPVPNVSVDGSSDSLADDVTDATGGYALPSLSGNLTVATLPKFGAPRAADENGAVTSFDASVIAQAAVGDVILSANQSVAGDVTGNAQVTSFDAAKVAQYAVGLIDHFDIAVGTGSDWKFLRCDNYVSATSQDCGPPQYLYTPIAGSETADFHAVLFGDVTGNWMPAAAFTSAPVSPAVEAESLAARRDRDQGARLRAGAIRKPVARTGAATLALTGWSGPLAAGERRTLLLHVSGAEAIEAVDLVLRYQPQRLRVVELRTVDLASGWSLASREGADGSRVALYGVMPLAGSGAVLAVTVEARELVRDAGMTLDAVANEGTVPLRIVRPSLPSRPGLPRGRED